MAAYARAVEIEIYDLRFTIYDLRGRREQDESNYPLTGKRFTIPALDRP
jgi:hypothetical protein